MAEPVFKLLRCDAEASHMLGWAKKEVRRLVNYASLDAFNRTWKFGDVSIKAQYFGGVARLWLEAAGTERMAVWATLPNPYPYRGVTIFESAPGAIPPVIVGTDYGHYPRVTTITMNGVEYARWVGTQILTVFYEPGCPHASNLIVYSNYADGGGNLLNGSRITGGCTGNPPVDVISTSIRTTPEYIAARGDAEAIAASTPGTAYVVASDGQILAQEDREFLLGGVVRSKVGTAIWNGAGYVDMFEVVNGDTLPHHRLEFGVPDDCIYPITESPPAYPGTGTPPASWAEDWATAFAVAKEREKAWLLTQSDVVLDELRAGGFEVPVSWGNVLKIGAPSSDNTKRPNIMSAGYDDAVVSDSSAGLTQPGVKITQRTVTLEYSAQTPEGETEQKQEIIIGTRTQTVTRHDNADGVQQMLSRVDAYDQWYEETQNPDAAALEIYLAHDFMRDGTSHGMNLFWSGEVQAVGGYHADSTFGAPAYAPVGVRYIPPQPAYFNTLAGAAPAFVLEYHANQKPRYDKTGGDQAWLSSALVPGATIKVIPLGRVSEDESLGIFSTGGAHVEVYGSAIFTYDYATGAISFVEWRPLPGGVEAIQIAIPDDYELGETNALLIYGGIKWDDVKEDARAQRKALNDPNDPAHDPLMKAVLDALTPTE